MNRLPKKVGDRYETGLLWKDPATKLANNRRVAESHLRSLERKLERNSELAVAYQKTIDTDLEKGYVKEWSPEEVQKPVKHQWFLPHHPVVNPNKPVKVRRVCNATATYANTSLNDHLLTGPDLLNPLIGILMRFREKRIA